MIELYPGERIEDLQYKGLRIIQSDTGFRFGTDSVLLASFVTGGTGDRIVDLGAGCGVIAILLEGRLGARLTAVELRPMGCSLARRSAELNGQEIEVVEGDMRSLSESLGRGVFDSAVCNPPYHSTRSGAVSQKGEPGFEGTATHETECTLEDVAGASSKLLKFGGKLFMCCPASRLAEAFRALTDEKLEPKRLRLVASRAEKAPYLALIEAKKGAAPGLRIEPALTIMNADGSFTQEIDRIYHRI